MKKSRKVNPEKYKNLDINELNKHFISACIKGKLEVVKYLLTSSDLNERIDIGTQGNYAVHWATEYGHLDIIRYLMTSPDLVEKGIRFVNIHADDDVCFRTACAYGKLEIVKYLLTSPELKDNGIDFANVHAQDDFAFISACGAGHWEVIKYLIADHRIAMTTNIETYLSREDVINFVGNDNVLNMFAVINNYEKLNQNLTTHFSTKKVNNKI